MEIRSTFRILVLFIALLTFSSHSVFGHADRLQSTEREVAPEQSAVLLIGDHHGLDETAVQNTALLVVKELRAQGITVSDPVHEVSVSGNVYRVMLRRSGEKILFRLSKEDSVGTLLVEREMLLTDIEKIAEAAPRLVYALVHRKPIPPSPVLGVLRNASVFTTPGRGVGIGLSVNRLSYAVDVGSQIAWTETGFFHDPNHEINDSLNFRSVLIGGRYFFSNQNVSPYVGGGIAAIFAKHTITVRTRLNGLDALFSQDEHSETGFGIGVYGVLGIEFRRGSQYRLKLELRIDSPFFKLPSQDVMPTTLGIVGGFSF